jgi:hypothetical protein
LERLEFLPYSKEVIILSTWLIAMKSKFYWGGLMRKETCQNAKLDTNKDHLPPLEKVIIGEKV